MAFTVDGTRAPRAAWRVLVVVANDLQARWRQLKRDTWDEPTIRSVGAFLLTGLVALIVWLTLEYAHKAEESGGGVISPDQGRATIWIVMAFTFIAGVEPLITRWIDQAIWAHGRRWFFSLPSPVRGLFAIVGCLLIAIPKVTSVAWSFVDYLLARPIAVIAGAKLRGLPRRYAAFGALMLLTGGVALLAAEGWLPVWAGLAGVATALALILGVVRRWVWFEADRDTYLIERGDSREIPPDRRAPREVRDQRILQLMLALACTVAVAAIVYQYWDVVASLPTLLRWPANILAWLMAAFFLAVGLTAFFHRPVGAGGVLESALRVGFKEDLRDEALIALVCLFLLVPLTLDLIYQHTCLTVCAFESEDPARIPIPTGIGDRLWLWLGFFGAELMKTVPFVDWSEVFKVANDSPIRPVGGATTPLGPQVVFVMRAGLDLLLLATVVQAIGMVSRLREQNVAFKNNQLPILEPFSEARELARAYDGIRKEVNIAPTEQYAIVAFPNYDAKRLRDLILRRDDTPTRIDGPTQDKVRRAAVALLAAKHKGSATDAFLFDTAKTENDDSFRTWMLEVASGLAPEPDPTRQQSDLDALLKLLADRVNRRTVPAPVRAAAARRIGRIGGNKRVAQALLDRVNDGDESEDVRADAAVALSKLVRTSPELQDQAVRATTALARAISVAFEARLAVPRPTDQPEHELSGERLLPVMAAAHALARMKVGCSEIRRLFHLNLRRQAQHAALIQIDPMGADEAKQREIGARSDQLVRIERGRFKMGANFSEAERRADIEEFGKSGLRKDQHPLTDVEVRRPFALGRFPVTNREYRGYCDANGLQSVDSSAGAIETRSERPQLVDSRKHKHYPVVQVSWYDANDYVRWLERVTGERYRLPTEAEWEYACRASTDTPYWWGEDYEHEGLHDYWKTENVNSDEPNPWGLRSMYGHVYEWCADPWHRNYEGHEGVGDVWLTGDCYPSKRVVRGGSFNWPRPGDDDKEGRRIEIRATYRNEQVPGHIQTNYGFRIARSVSC